MGRGRTSEEEGEPFDRLRVIFGAQKSGGNGRAGGVLGGEGASRAKRHDLQAAALLVLDVLQELGLLLLLVLGAAELLDELVVDEGVALE